MTIEELTAMIATVVRYHDDALKVADLVDRAFGEEVQALQKKLDDKRSEVLSLRKLVEQQQDAAHGDTIHRHHVSEPDRQANPAAEMGTVSWKPSEFGQCCKVSEEDYEAYLDVRELGATFWPWACTVSKSGDVSYKCVVNGKASSIERAKADAEAAMSQIVLEFPYTLRNIEAVTRHPRLDGADKGSQS